MAQTYTTPTTPAKRGRPRKAIAVAAPIQFPGKVIRLKSRPRLVIGDLVEICGNALSGNIGKLAVIKEYHDDGFVQVESVLYMLDAKDLKTGKVTRNNSRLGRLLPENLYRLDNSRLPEVVRRIK